MRKPQFAVIGLGRFGSSVARALAREGYEVLAIDANAQRVQELSETVTHAVAADATDEEALRSLGLRNFDVVVVAIGQDIQASILASLILKDMGVPKLVAKAQSELHGKVLHKIGVDQVIYPERDMGQRLAHQLISPNVIDYLELSSEHSVVEMRASGRMAGRTLRELDIRARFGCNVMAIRSGNAMNVTPRADDRIAEGDVLVVVGRNEDLQEMERFFSE